MYLFLAGVVTGLVLGVLSRKLSESASLTATDLQSLTHFVEESRYLREFCSLFIETIRYLASLRRGNLQLNHLL
jgi:hypothetical protein